MSILAASSYSNPYRLIADGQARTTARNTPPASAAATPPKANGTANFADALPSDAPAPKAFELKFQDDSKDAMLTRVAKYQETVAQKAKTDPQVAFIENLKDKYMNVKGSVTVDSVRMDGMVVRAAETDAKVRNNFVAYSTGRLDNIISSLQYIKNGGANQRAALSDAASELEKLIDFSRSNNSSNELDSLTSEYTQFKTGSTITLAELRRSLDV